MKNSDEMVNSLFERRKQYAAEQKRKRMVLNRAVTSLCSVCLVALIGVGVLQGNWIYTAPPISIDDPTVDGGKDHTSPGGSTDPSDEDQVQGHSGNQTDATGNKVQDNSENQTDAATHPNEDPVQDNSGNQTDATHTNPPSVEDNDIADMIGIVVIDDITYVQFSINEKLFTANDCLGDAGDYSSYYDNLDISATLYTTKESQNVVLVKLGNGATIVLGRDGELIIKGTTYFSTGIDANTFVQGEYLGKAKDFDIISVPHRNTVISAEDDIWSVEDDATKLIVKKSDGSTIVFSALS